MSIPHLVTLAINSKYRRTEMVAYDRVSLTIHQIGGRNKAFKNPSSKIGVFLNAYRLNSFPSNALFF
ncbi:hypothetical protein [Capnocytophaga leadbetteri]|uniref:hypothetical protein n=1 Tax=Capnocytophaga leadbetteri TaxID=327575 RepID=UPI0028EE6C0B|nr:hypothetical protein [Capnocytophaga leadbetteri]